MTKENEKDARAPDGVENTDDETKHIETPSGFVETLRNGKLYSHYREPAPMLHKDWWWGDFFDPSTDYFRTPSNLSTDSFKAHRDNFFINDDFYLRHIVARTEEDNDKLRRLMDGVQYSRDETYKMFVEEAIKELFLARMNEISNLVERHIKRLEKLLMRKLSEIAFGPNKTAQYDYFYDDPPLRERATEIKSFIVWYKELLNVIRSQSDSIEKQLPEIRKKLRRTFNEDFGTRLKQARDKKKYSAQFVSKLMNISPSAYSNYECGLREPPLYLLVKLSTLLEVRLDWLLGRSDY